MTFLITLIGLSIAIWQLVEQVRETKHNGKMDYLLQLNTQLQHKIDHYEHIIDDRKVAGQSWKGHAEVVNERLRPLQQKLFLDIRQEMSQYRRYEHQEVWQELLCTEVYEIKEK